MEKKQPGQAKSAVIVHGGAGVIRPDQAKGLLPDLEHARDAAWRIVSAGGPALDAAAAALGVMEDSDYFDAGYGSYPNSQGLIRMDVGLMHGARKFYSLLNVRRMKRPAMLALELLRRGPSRVTVWTDELAAEIDSADEQLKQRIGWVAAESEMVSSRAVEYCKRALAEQHKQGTVGCLVRDSTGMLAAGTSTGGTPGKPAGRIGDSPIVGCGVYADNDICALSMSGDGEQIIGSAMPGFVVSRVRDAKPAADSAEKQLRRLLREELAALSRNWGGTAGAILLCPEGAPVYEFSSPQMAVASKYLTDAGELKEEALVDQRNAPSIKR